MSFHNNQLFFSFSKTHRPIFELEKKKKSIQVLYSIKKKQKNPQADKQNQKYQRSKTSNICGFFFFFFYCGQKCWRDCIWVGVSCKGTKLSSVYPLQECWRKKKKKWRSILSVQNLISKSPKNQIWHMKTTRAYNL